MSHPAEIPEPHENTTSADNQPLCALAGLAFFQDFPSGRPEQLICLKPDAAGRICGATAVFISQQKTGAELEFASVEDWAQKPCQAIAAAMHQIVCGGVGLSRMDRHEHQEYGSGPDTQAPLAG